MNEFRKPVFFWEARGRRDVIQTAYDIIIACITPNKVTTVMRLANIQYDKLYTYLDRLTEIGLLERIPFLTEKRGARFRCKATDAGLQFARVVKDLYDVYDGKKEMPTKLDLALSSMEPEEIKERPLRPF